MNFNVNCVENSVIQYPMHTHKNYEIILYLEGEGRMLTELGSVPFEKGTIVIIPPDVKHGSVSENGFKNISVEGAFGEYLHFNTVKSFSDNEKCEGTKLAQMIYDNRYGNVTYLTSLCTTYIYFLTQRIEIDSPVQKCIQKIIFEISQNALDPQLDLSLILSKSGYSEDYIRSCFKKITEKTPNKFLTEVRIKHACFLIDVYNGELSLTEISERCGYTDYVYFSKRFKSVVGMSPKEYKIK